LSPSQPDGSALPLYEIQFVFKENEVLIQFQKLFVAPGEHSAEHFAQAVILILKQFRKVPSQSFDPFRQADAEISEQAPGQIAERSSLLEAL